MLIHLEKELKAHVSIINILSQIILVVGAVLCIVGFLGSPPFRCQ